MQTTTKRIHSVLFTELIDHGFLIVCFTSALKLPGVLGYKSLDFRKKDGAKKEEEEEERRKTYIEGERGIDVKE